MSSISQESEHPVSETSSSKDCNFCDQLLSKFSSHTMLKQALYFKYAQSQTYFYTKEINELMSNARNQKCISFRCIIFNNDQQTSVTT